jgi:hypothetical protein
MNQISFWLSMMEYFASARSIASSNKIDPTRIEIIQQWLIGLSNKCKIKDIKKGGVCIQIVVSN